MIPCVHGLDYGSFEGSCEQDCYTCSWLCAYPGPEEIELLSEGIGSDFKADRKPNFLG